MKCLSAYFAAAGAAFLAILAFDLDFALAFALDFALTGAAAFSAGAAIGAAAGAAIGAAGVWAAAGVEITAKGMARTAALARMDRNFFMTNSGVLEKYLRACCQVSQRCGWLQASRS